MKILITGAAGRTSGYVIKDLLERKSVPVSELRLLVRSDEAVEKVRVRFPQLGHSSFVIGDYLEASTLPHAFKDIDIVFYNGPTFTPLETAMGIAAIQAARNAGVKHYVFCSVHHPFLTKLLNHKAKLDIEEYLVESGLNWTILQPTSFMQNVDIKSVVKDGKLRVPYNPKTLQGFLDLKDFAEVASEVILNPANHNLATYELVGENTTLESVAQMPIIHQFRGLSDTRCELVPRDKLLESGMVHLKVQGPDMREGLGRMLYYYDQRGIPGNSNTIRWLLGRSATTWEGFIRREAWMY